MRSRFSQGLTPQLYRVTVAGAVHTDHPMNFVGERGRCEFSSHLFLHSRVLQSACFENALEDVFWSNVQLFVA